MDHEPKTIDTSPPHVLPNVQCHSCPHFFSSTEAAIKHLADNSVAVVTMTKSAGSALDIGPTPHSRLDGTKDHRWTIPDLDATSAVERGEPVGMRVQIERTVRVEDPSEVEIDVPRSHEHPTSTWTSHGTWSTTGDTSDIRATWDPQERWMMTTR